MKYLHGFNKDIDFHSEYDDDSKYFEPWTSLTHENEEVNYNRKKGEEYLTFEILTSGELYLGEILFSELESSLENTIKNEHSNSEDYLFNDKYDHLLELNTNEESDNSGGDGGFVKKATRAKANSIKYKAFLEEFPTLPGIKYKLNDSDWVDWEINPDTYYRTLNVEAGDIVQIKGSKEYLNIFEGNNSWLDPRDIDSSKAVVSKIQSSEEYDIKDFTITINHTDIDFNSTGFGDLSDISSWKENFLEEYDDSYYSEIPEIPKTRINNQNILKAKNTNSHNVILEDNQFIYSGKIKYHFKNIKFTKIEPVKISDDVLIKGLFVLDSSFDGTSTYHSLKTVIYPNLISLFLDNLLEKYNISLNDIVSFEESDDPHIKYFSYDIYDIYRTYTDYGYGYYGSYSQQLIRNKIGLSVFGFLLFDDDNNLIGFSSIPNTLENFYGHFHTILNSTIFYPSKSLLATTLDYIEENDFSKPIILEYDLDNIFIPDLPPISPITTSSILNSNGIKKDFPTVTNDENTDSLLIFSYDKDYLNSLKEKYVKNINDYLLLDRRFNFRASDECTFNVRGNVASLYYGEDFVNKITYKIQGIYAGLFYKCDGLISCKNIYLPGYILSPDCYFAMFAYCSNLIEVFENFNNNMKFADGAFSGMFFKCTSLTSTVLFPFDKDYTSYNELFSAMYYGDSSLSTISPINMFTDIPNAQFAFTFSNCDSIVELPDLSNINYIGPKGCFCMFSNCDGLEELNDLHFKKVDAFGISGMFYNCSSLERVGKVEFDAINYSGAEKLFACCQSLIEIDSVFANNSNSNDYAYAYMFSDCSALVNPPSLPQEKVAPYLYYKMFYNCILLLSAPELNALNGKSGIIINTNNWSGGGERRLSINSRSEMGMGNITHSEYLSTGCYESMFENCTSLNSIITLPALKVYNRSYYKMFYNCTSLVTMPTILAKEIGEKSFGYMFSHCSSLTEVNPIFVNVCPFNKNNTFVEFQ